MERRQPGCNVRDEPSKPDSELGREENWGPQGAGRITQGKGTMTMVIGRERTGNVLMKPEQVG